MPLRQNSARLMKYEDIKVALVWFVFHIYIRRSTTP